SGQPRVAVPLNKLNQAPATLTLTEGQPKMEVPRKLTLDVLSIPTGEIRCAIAVVPIGFLRSHCQG
ncbi:MAG: hypothetical protein WCA19_12255, partial [Candidatus Acidiferrales bacterium]